MPGKPRRILQLVSTSDLGGAERMVLHLLGALDRAEFEPLAAATTGSGELLRLAAPACAASVHLHARFAGDPLALARLVRFIRANHVELLQIHGLRAELIGRVAARLGGARAVVSTVHSIDPWRRWHHSLADRLTAPLVDHTIAVCAAARDAAIARGEVGPDRIEVIPIGIPSAPDRDPARMPALRGQFGIPPGAGPVVGVVANLREMKGHRDILAAIPAVRSRHPDALFVFAGRDDSGGAIGREAAAAGVADRIRFLGFVDDAPALLGALDIFLLPSHWEGLPVSIIEAMHAGLPVVASGVGGIPELITDGETGLLIEPRSPDRISGAILRLAGDPDLSARLGGAARARARAEFTVERMAARTQAVYRRLLNR